MPRFRPRAHAAQRVLAALTLALVLLGGCRAGAKPAGGAQSRPDPFALGLPTPTDTPGAHITPAATWTFTPQSTASTPAIARPGATLTVAPGSATSTAALTWTATVASGSTTPTAAPAWTATVAPGSTTPTATGATLSATPAPSATLPPPLATSSPPAGQTRTATAVPADTPTALSTPTPTPTRSIAATATWTPAPLPTQEAPVPWNLARDVIGLWEFVDGEGWRYYFDFLADGRVVVAQAGVRTYRVRDSRTLLIQHPENERPLTVVDLTADRLVLQGFTLEPQAFYRVPGTPALGSKIVGLWLDESGVYPSIEFAADGLVAGEFGRGTYQVVSDNTVLVACAPSQDCEPYREHGQEDDAPLLLRIHWVTGDTLVVEGLGSSQQWTLTYREGMSDLAGRLVGRWVREPGSMVFEGDGDLVLDDEIYGRWEVLGRSTFWIEYEGEERGHSWVVIRLTDSELAFAEWGAFYEDDLWTFERGGSTP